MFDCAGQNFDCERGPDHIPADVDIAGIGVSIKDVIDFPSGAHVRR
jgi:hypothetical protein